LLELVPLGNWVVAWVEACTAAVCTFFDHVFTATGFFGSSSSLTRALLLWKCFMYAKSQPRSLTYHGSLLQPTDHQTGLILRVAVRPHDRLVLVRLDSLQRPDDLEVLLDGLALADHLLRRGVVLLVAHEDVVDQRTLGGQEPGGHLQRLAVEELGLAAPGHGVCVGLLLHLHDEAQLGGDAEVGHGQEADLLEDQLAAELVLDAGGGVDVLHREGRDLHDVPDVQRPNPVRLVQVAQQVAHVHLVEQRVELRGDGVGGRLLWPGCLLAGQVVERLAEGDVLGDESALEFFGDGEEFDSSLGEEGELRVVEKVNMFFSFFSNVIIIVILISFILIFIL